MSTRCQYVVLAILVTIGNVVFSQAPITWPDPRHFKISLDRTTGLRVTATWEVNEYCHQNSLQDFNFFAERADGSKSAHYIGYSSYYQDPKMIILDMPSTKYTVTGAVKTIFHPQEITANLTVVSGGAVAFGNTYSRPLQKVSSAYSKGKGSHMVILKDKATKECLLVVYDNKTTAESYSIEGTKHCREGSLPKISLLLPMEVEPVYNLPDLKLLKFNIPQEYLSDLPDFFVSSDAIQKGSTFELDPPQDVYGKLNLESPDTATLILTFRPPASHPKLIKSFTFKFSNQNEAIVYLIRSDEVAASTTTNLSISTSQLIQVQGHLKTVLEIYPINKFKYPGNYSVTVYTNDAKQNRHVIPIIMPNFEALAPNFYTVDFSGHSAKLSWGEPHLFGRSCSYRVLAEPTENRGVPIVAFVKPNQRKVMFDSLLPATEYKFTLKTTCETSKEVLTNLGSGKTGPREPGEVRNLHIELIKAGDVKLSWNPPEVMEGDSHYYTYVCEHQSDQKAHSKVTSDTTVTIKYVAPGRFTCFVFATSSVKDHDQKRGPKSDVVSVHVPSDLILSIPTVDIKKTTGSTIDLKIKNEERSDIIAVLVDVESTLSFAFFIDDLSTPMNITNLRNTSVKVVRNGLTSFLLTNLIKDKTYSVTVTYLYFASQMVENTYKISPDFESNHLNDIVEHDEETSDTERENLKSKTKVAFVIVLGIILLAMSVGIFVWQYKQCHSKNGPPLIEQVEQI